MNPALRRVEDLSNRLRTYRDSAAAALVRATRKEFGHAIDSGRDQRASQRSIAGIGREGDGQAAAAGGVQIAKGILTSGGGIPAA